MHLSIGGVPEHFNLPWQQAIVQDAFSQAGIDLSWTYYSGGTGAMTKALANGDLDMAILLTEGFLSAFSNGLEARLVKVYIDTPLVWGIHTGAPNIHSVGPGRYAISRFGSGSHLMAMIHAEQRGQTLREEDFEIVRSLEGAIHSLVERTSDYFYWEKFMTKPFVDDGSVRLIGEFSAPWSSFLVVATDAALRRKSWSIRAVLEIMNARCRLFPEEVTTVPTLVSRFSMTPAEARQWLGNTRWNQDFSVDRNQLISARTSLSRIGMCRPDLEVDDCCADWMTLSDTE